MLKLLFAAAAIAAAGEGLPTRAPSAVGMSAERLAAIDRVVMRGVTGGGYPGASVVIGRQGYAVYQRGFGRLDWVHSTLVDPAETIYDLASLTKVVATTTAIMVLYDEGSIDLDAPVSLYIPEFSGGSKDLVTVRHLLTHRSGLPASRDLWRVASSPADAKRLTLETPLRSHPGTSYVYSDLGAITLGILVERVSGLGLDEFMYEKVFGPLGMTNTFFRPSGEMRDRIAPTEVAPPRGYPLRGEVHDENAYALGGIAGHAGLFSTATDLSMFAQMMLNGGELNGVRVLSDSTVHLFTQRTAGIRALGWAMADGQWGSGRYLSETGYGHIGYTGTSLWIDPDRDMFVVLLTNRVHAARAKRPAKVIADVRADLSDAAAAAVLDGPSGPLAMPSSFRADRAEGWNRSVRTVKARSSKARRASSSKARRSTTAKARTSSSAAKRPALRTTAKSSAAKKPVVKKATTAKKSTAKRPTAKKATTAKKPVAKKPVARRQ